MFGHIFSRCILNKTVKCNLKNQSHASIRKQRKPKFLKVAIMRLPGCKFRFLTYLLSTRLALCSPRESTFATSFSELLLVSVVLCHRRKTRTRKASEFFSRQDEDLTGVVGVGDEHGGILSQQSSNFSLC